MKKVFVLLFAFVLLLTVTACDKKEEGKSTGGNSGSGTSAVSGEMIHEHCTRTGKIDDNSSAEMTYEIYYTGEVLNRIESTERVTSTSKDVLDEYENAYRQIHSYYEDIDHYDTSVIRSSSSVASKMSIDYDKINLEELIALEGEEDNIFENGKPMIAKYKELAKKLGVKCEKVS